MPITLKTDMHKELHI